MASAHCSVGFPVQSVHYELRQSSCFGLRPTRLAQPAALKSSKRIQSRRPAPLRTWNAGRAAPRRPRAQSRADQSSEATRRQHASAREERERERKDLLHTLSNRLRYRSRRTASGARVVLLRAQQVFRRVTSCCSASASVLFCSAALCCTLYCTALCCSFHKSRRRLAIGLRLDSSPLKLK